jgi:hypothetical protein
MTNLIYYVAMPFIRTEERDLPDGEAKQPSAGGGVGI